jgi:outer membrane receptor for ferric coprogen and ferric-rhodotorulic acid
LIHLASFLRPFKIENDLTIAARTLLRAAATALAVTLSIVSMTSMTVSAAHAQPIGAALSGVVTDTSGAVVPGVWLTLADAASGVQRQTTANERGEYAFAGLPAGRYVLSAGHDGFAPARIVDITLADGEQRALAVTLRVAPLAETVSIEAASGYTAAGATAGSKIARELKDIPQSVSVVTEQRIRDQQLTTVIDALGQATGVTIAHDNYESVYARGFEIKNMQFDGGSPSHINNYADYSGLPDLATYERIEVLRGADGLFGGAGEAGGTINLVRKQPRARRQVSFDAFAGSWNHFRAQLDATGALGWNGRLRGRVVAAQETRDLFYDYGTSDTSIVYGIAEADVTSRTVITFGTRFERLDTVPNTIGIPRYSNGVDLKLPRSTYLGAKWSYWDTNTTEIFGVVKQSLGGSWSLRVNVSQQRRDMDVKYAALAGGVNPVTLGESFVFATEVDYAPTQRLADVTLTGRVPLFGAPQEVTLGANWQDVDGSSFKQSSLGFELVDMADFDAATWPEPSSTTHWGSLYGALGHNQHGVYASVRSRLSSRLHTTVGARVSSFEYERIQTDFDPETGVQIGRNYLYSKDSNVPTFFGGATFDATPALTIYGSVAEIFQTQGTNVTEEGEPLKPITGISYEAGVKGAWLGGAVTGSLAAYRVQRKNAAVQTSATGFFGDFYCCYVAAAEISSTGLDAELTGRIRAGWEVFAGYTLNNTRYERGTGESDGSAYFPLMPRHLLKIWSMVRLPGRLSAVRVGGGINAQSKTYVSGTASTYDATGNSIGSTPFEFTQDGYALVTVRGEYRINDRWSAAVNVNNVFDRTYYQTVGSTLGFNYYGAPRSVVTTLRVRY